MVFLSRLFPVFSLLNADHCRTIEMCLSKISSPSKINKPNRHIDHSWFQSNIRRKLSGVVFLCFLHDREWSATLSCVALHELQCRRPDSLQCVPPVSNGENCWAFTKERNRNCGTIYSVVSHFYYTTTELSGADVPVLFQSILYIGLVYIGQGRALLINNGIIYTTLRVAERNNYDHQQYGINMINMKYSYNYEHSTADFVDYSVESRLKSIFSRV